MKKFLKVFWKDLDINQMFDGAASLSFYFVFSLFPIMLIFVSILSYMPEDFADGRYMQLIISSLPDSLSIFLSTILKNVKGDNSLNSLSLGFLFAIWSGSNGNAAIIRQLNISYEVKESRNFLKFRGTCLGLLLFQILVFIFPLIFYFVGKNFLAFLPGSFADFFIVFLKVPWLKFVAFELILLCLFASIYYIGPNVKQKFKFISPGSIFGSTVMLVMAKVFEVYIKNYGTYNETYGAVGAVIILLLWLYMMGLLIILGAKINQSIRKISSSSLQE